MPSRLTNLPVPFTFQFNIDAAGTPEQLSCKRRAATIAFNENNGAADTITDSASGFLIAGFQAGDSIVVSGSASNDGTYVIDTVTAGTITLLGRNDLTTEVAGATVKITADKVIPDGIQVTVKAKNGNGNFIYVSYSSETALNSAGAAFSLDNNESVGLQVNQLSNIWLDAGVNAEGVEVIFEKR